jgi:hypothetical protein
MSPAIPAQRTPEILTPDRRKPGRLNDIDSFVGSEYGCACTQIGMSQEELATWRKPRSCGPAPTQDLPFDLCIPPNAQHADAGVPGTFGYSTPFSGVPNRIERRTARTTYSAMQR